MNQYSLIAGVGLFLSACAGAGPSTPFVGDPGVAAIEPGQEELEVQDGALSPYCNPVDGKFEEKTAQISEQGKKTITDENGNPVEIFYASGGGCILRPLSEVTAVAHNSATWIWSDQAKLAAFNPEFDIHQPLGKTTHFTGQYKAGGGMVSWLLDYYMTLQEGESWKAPAKVLINYKKVKGTNYIPYWTGTIELKSVADNVTSFILRENLKAHEATEQNCLKSINGALERLRTLGPEWKFIGLGG